MNQVIIIGRLVRDPEVRYNPNGEKAVCNFTLAVDKGLPKDKKAEYEEKGYATADFINVVAFGKMGETLQNYCCKGGRLAVIGRLSTRKYETKSGEKSIWTEVLANNVDIIDFKDKNTLYDDEVEDESTFETFNDANIPF